MPTQYFAILSSLIVLGAIAQQQSLMLPSFWQITITGLISFFLGYLIKKTQAKS
jgi:hypothetical protein